MRKTILLIIAMLLLTVWRACATGVGVVPDKLVFDGDEKEFRIMNPNQDILAFNIAADELECEPKEGEIEPKSSETILCSAKNSIAGKSKILVETMQEGGTIGMLPAVAIDVEIKREEKKASPLLIEGNATAEDTQQKDATPKNMTPEYITIALLTLAILSVLAYGEIKKRNPNCHDGPSRQDAPSGQSAASASASQNQQQQAPSHDERAGNPQI
ncbi:hypothetical protein HZB90_00960 [archaeon]|nr:hypothetical protein [archaeon]